MEVPDFSSQSSKSPVPSDSFDMNSFPQSIDGIAANPNPIPISIPPTSYSPPQPMSQPPSKTIMKAKSNEFLDKRSRGTHCSSSTVEHNISEKKRIGANEPVHQRAVRPARGGPPSPASHVVLGRLHSQEQGDCSHRDHQEDPLPRVCREGAAAEGPRCGGDPRGSPSLLVQRPAAQ